MMADNAYKPLAENQFKKNNAKRQQRRVMEPYRGNSPLDILFIWIKILILLAELDNFIHINNLTYRTIELECMASNVVRQFGD